MSSSNLEIIAHRGFSQIAPENTLAAFSAALQSQARSVEFDLQLSADGELIIIHDLTLERTTSGGGQVKDFTLEQLRQLDAGSWFDAKFAAERIPTLTEALTLLQDIPRHIYIEVKNAPHWSDAGVDKLVDILEKYPQKNKCIVSCFQSEFLIRVQQRSRQITLGYLAASNEEYAEKLRLASSNPGSVIIGHYEIILDNPVLISTSRFQETDIVVWTVNSIKTWEKLVKLGITRIVTDRLIPSC